MIDLSQFSPETVNTIVDVAVATAVTGFALLGGSEAIAHSKLKSNGWFQLIFRIFKAILLGVSRGNGTR